MIKTNPISFLVNHWKKTLFIVPAVSAASYYAYDLQKTKTLMKASCRRVSLWGDVKLGPQNPEVRHITVVLNPIAGKRKAKKLYTRWVEPLLHLSGSKVSLVETDGPNQPFELMKIMSNCDAVAIVGGDETVDEAINGLLARPDGPEAISSFPIAIIPVGQNNNIAKKLYENFHYRNLKELLIHTTMGLITSTAKPIDVTKITSQATEEDKPYPMLNIYLPGENPNGDNKTYDL